MRDPSIDLLRKFCLVVALAVSLSCVGEKTADSNHSSGSEMAPQSILLLVVDTLRADHLGTYGYDRPTTPHLDRWAEQAVVFEQAMATSPWTLPTVGSILTGRFPHRHGAGVPFGTGPRRGADPADLPRVRSFGRFSPLPSELPTLAGELRAAGYATAAIVNNPFLSSPFGVGRGFEEYDAAQPEAPARAADTVIDLALSWLESVERPFFLMVHLYDPHLPYAPPAPFAGRFTAEFDASSLSLPLLSARKLRSQAPHLSEVDRQFVTAAYDEEVLFLDAQIGRFFERLAASGRLESTVVALTSDHGEELFDHGGFEHGHTMYQELLRVPLMIWNPGLAARRVAPARSLVDLAPTLLDAAQVALPGDLDGESLWPQLVAATPIESRPLIAQWNLYGPQQHAVLDWPDKLVFDATGQPVRWFDLASDPTEQRDLRGDRPERASELIGLADQLLVDGRLAQDEVELDEALQRELESLGYID